MKYPPGADFIYAVRYDTIRSLIIVDSVSTSKSVFCITIFAKNVHSVQPSNRQTHEINFHINAVAANASKLNRKEIDRINITVLTHKD